MTSLLRRQDHLEGDILEVHCPLAGWQGVDLWRALGANGVAVESAHNRQGRSSPCRCDANALDFWGATGSSRTGPVRAESELRRGNRAVGFPVNILNRYIEHAGILPQAVTVGGAGGDSEYHVHQDVVSGNLGLRRPRQYRQGHHRREQRTSHRRTSKMPILTGDGQHA